MGPGFERCYLRLLVALWLELDRLAAELGAAATGGHLTHAELGREAFLLELDLLASASDRWRDLRLVTAAERQRLRDLVAALRAPFGAVPAEPPDEGATAPVIRAQNRLYNEIRARALPLASSAPRAG